MRDGAGSLWSVSAGIGCGSAPLARREGGMSTVDRTRVRLVLEDAEADPELLETDLGYLLDEVAQLHGVEVDRVEVEAPPDARGGTGVEVGAALIALGSSGATLP